MSTPRTSHEFARWIPPQKENEERVGRSTAFLPLISHANWFVAARTEELLREPVARLVNGLHLVLYRDSRGRAVAMEDRCPHKQVPLSLGRVKGDTLECRYHGWRFDPSGICVAVPCDSPREKMPACKIKTFRTIERDDWIWVNPVPGPEVTSEPPRYPKDPRYGWFEFVNEIEAPLDLILENGLDCSHTGFAHEGLFRSEPTQYITANIEATDTGLRVATVGESAKRNGDVRSSLSNGNTIDHTDEIILPHTLRVDYRVGVRTHVITVLVCTPVSPTRTRMYTRMGVYYRGFTWLATRYVKYLTRKVIAQDVEILVNQTECIRRLGRRDFRAVTADQPATWLQRILRRANTSSPLPRQRSVVYKL